MVVEVCYYGGGNRVFHIVICVLQFLFNKVTKLNCKKNIYINSFFLKYCHYIVCFFLNCCHRVVSVGFLTVDNELSHCFQFLCLLCDTVFVLFFFYFGAMTLTY